MFRPWRSARHKSYGQGLPVPSTYFYCRREQANGVEILDLAVDVALSEGYVMHVHLKVGVSKRLHDCSGNWDHFNLIFPDYLKLMTGFPSVYPDEVGAELLH